MKQLTLILFLLIATLVWPLDLSETIAACVLLAIVGAVSRLSPLGKVNIMS